MTTLKSDSTSGRMGAAVEAIRMLARRSAAGFTRTLQRKLIPIVSRIFSATHVSLYQKTGGALGGRFQGDDVLLLTTTGRKTGKARTTPVLYLADGDRLVIVASNGGMDWSPQWWLNLQRTPEAQVQVGRQRMRVRAGQAKQAEAQQLWARFIARYPVYATYAERTTRPLPVIILQPITHA